VPARKTIDEAAAARNRRRSRLVMTVIGAIPIVILVVLGGVFFYQRATELGPDELPSSIGGGERQDIQAAIEGFYELVNKYEPQPITDTIVWDKENATEHDLNRLIYELSAVLGEQLKFELQTVGAITLDSQRDAVRARAVTNLGTKEVVLKRRDGQWRVAQPVDLGVPQEAGPLRLEWETLNTFRSDDGKLLRIAGRVKNTSDGMGFLVTFAGYIAADDGRTLATASQPLAGSPFIHPGEETYFDVTFPEPEGAPGLDPARAVFVPDFRPAGPNDEAVVAKRVNVSPALLTWPAEAGATVTVTNQETRGVNVRVFALLRDASGRFLGVYPPQPGKIGAGDQLQVAGPEALPGALAGARTLDVRVYATFQR